MDLKTGWKTSEFWVALAGIVSTAVGILPQAGLLPIVGYAVSRTMAKIGQDEKPGMTTSEFLIVALNAVIGILATIPGVPAPIAMLLGHASASFLVNGFVTIYPLIRGFLKMNKAPVVSPAAIASGMHPDIIAAAGQAAARVIADHLPPQGK